MPHKRRLKMPGASEAAPWYCSNIGCIKVLIDACVSITSYLSRLDPSNVACVRFSGQRHFACFEWHMPNHNSQSLAWN